MKGALMNTSNTTGLALLAWIEKVWTTMRMACGYGVSVLFCCFGLNAGNQAADASLSTKPVGYDRKITIDLREGATLELVPIPKGRFMMGSSKDESGRRGDEFLSESVVVDRPFWIGTYEVTSYQYGALTGLLRVFPSLRENLNRPMAFLTWENAQSFCSRLTERELLAGRLPLGYEYRLPTEVEWEYACRAGKEGPFGIGGGDSLGSGQANFDGAYPYGEAMKGSAEGESVDVGTYSANAWGVHDMHGNLWEWCLDSYCLPGENDSDESSELKTIRGGGYSSSGRFCRAATRLGCPQSLRRTNTGFRVVLAPKLNPTTRIVEDTVWSLDESPYRVSNEIAVAEGVTLTIEAGVKVLFAQGKGMTISGRLLAEGTPENRIVFTRLDNAGDWSQLRFNPSKMTSVLAFVEMSYFGESACQAIGTNLHLEDIKWTNSSEGVLDLHRSSIVLLNSNVPGGAGKEPIHFSEMPSEGHALIQGCVFEAPQGYNDSIDFTGGNRPGPIVEFIDNIFLGAVDDCFDMDGTDAHIEGNIFLNVLQDTPRDSSSNPISTGRDEGDDTSELVICRNIFYNCEHALLLKDKGAALMQNNTIVNLVSNERARRDDGELILPGLIQFGEPWRGSSPGAGAIYSGNIAFDLTGAILSNLFPHYDPRDSFLVVSDSLLEGPRWPGEGNISADPMFVNLSGKMTYENIRRKLALRAESPCIGTGPNGLDMGALVPAGASISGEPEGVTSQNSATLTVGGPGIYSYRWKLNEGPWSRELSLVNDLRITPEMFNDAESIELENLEDGDYTVYVVGKNSAGRWQSIAAPTVSKTWTVRN